MKKTFILFLFLILLNPIKVNAFSGEIKLSCSPSVATAKSTIVCNVTGTSDEEISGFSASLNLSSNLKYVNFVADPIWLGDNSGNKIGLYTSENKKGQFNIGVITLEVKDGVYDRNETISLLDCQYSSGKPNYSKIVLSDATENIRIPSSNNRLSSLVVSPGNIDFNPDTLNYSTEVDSATVNIDATSEFDKSVISGDIGNKNLNYGTNIFKINVTSEDGEIRTYTLNVNRKDDRSSENRLSDLTIGEDKISINESKYDYDIVVDYNTTNINIKTNLKDSKSSYVSGYEPGNKELQEGLNKFEIKVKAENGNISTYTINITRSEDPENRSDDTYLDELKIGNGKIDFSKEQEEYKITVSNEVNNLKIDTITSSDKSSVEIIGNENFQVGENTVIVKVTSRDGSVREYKIIVTKKEVLSNNNYLKSLEISGYEIDFAKDKLNYELNISKERKLDIIALAEHENAKVKITGNNKLKNKSIIKITVTAEDDSTRIYNINIIKKFKINSLRIVIFIETIIVIIVMTIVIRRERKNGWRE